MNVNALCAADWTAYLLDVFVFIFLLGFAIVCARKGFVECFFGFVSTIVAMILAFTFAKFLYHWTDGLFGLGGFLEGKFTKVFSKVDGFDVDISSQGVQAALKEQDLPAILVTLVTSSFGKVDLPVGTTIGSMLGASVSKFAVTLLCGITVFIAAKLLIGLLKKILSSIISKITLLDKLDSLLGALVGVLEGVLVVCLLLSIVTMIPSQTLSNYLDNSLFVGALYNYNPLVHILGWIL